MRQYINFQSKPMEIYKVLNFGLNQSPESLKAQASSPNLNNQIEYWAMVEENSKKLNLSYDKSIEILRGCLVEEFD